MKRFVVALAVAFAASVVLAADPPTLVNYQGVLRDSSDKPRTGTFDIVFRFFDAVTAGSEILVDSHTGGGGNAVTVNGGLFNAQLGGGTVTDGSGAGTYTSLADVFRDYGATWLEITVGGEVLSPRIRIQSAAYALNASNLEGKPASGFIDTTGSSQTKAGHLIVNNGIEASIASGTGIIANGSQTGGSFGNAGGAFAYVADSGFINTGIRAQGNTAGGWFRNNLTLDEAWLGYNSYGVQAHGGNGGGYFYNSGSDYAYAATPGIGLYGYGTNYGVQAYGNVAAGAFQTGGSTSYLAIGNTGVYGVGAPGGQFYSISGAGSIDLGSSDFGALGHGRYPAAGGYFDDTSNTGKSWIGFGDEGIYGIGAYAGGFFTRSYHNVNAYLGSSDYFGEPVGVYGYSNEVSAYPGFFRDDVYGSHAWVGALGDKILGNGGVSFIQNHPVDTGKTIVYTAPEGDETAVYTRGSSQLVNGEAHVALGETFAWVANPDIGLTAIVTPKGDPIPLAVAETSTHTLVVRGPAGSNAEFDYMVWGLRIGFEDRAVVQVKRADAPIPSHRVEEDQYSKAPELRSYSALSRFTRMEQTLRGSAGAPNLAASKALETAIHVFDPATDAVGPHKNGPEPLAPKDAPPRVAAPSAGGDSVGPARASSASRPPTPALPTRSETGGAATATSSAPLPNTTPVALAEPAEAGDLLANDAAHPGELRRAALAADPGLIGIVAGSAGTVWTTEAPVALPGTIVICHVDASYGAIAANDLLVASATPGHAMRAGENPRQGTVVGKALEPWEAGTGTIRVLAMPR
jgi:hypothetical protein